MGGEKKSSPLGGAKVAVDEQQHTSDKMVELYKPAEVSAERRASIARTIDGMEKRLKAIRNKEGHLIHPHHTFMRRWDIITLVSLAFTAIITPYEIAVLQSTLQDNSSIILYAINRVVDLVFTIDIAVQCVLMTEDEGTGRICKDHRRIFWAYARGWMLIDIVSVLPGYADWSLVGESPGSSQHDAIISSLSNTTDIDTQDTGSGFRTARMAKLVRVFRVFRLLKMVRIVKFQRILNRWSAEINIQSNTVTVLQNFAIMMLTCHWVACLWALSPQFTPRNDVTWLTVWLESTSPQCLDDNYPDVPHAAAPRDPHAETTNGFFWKACWEPHEVYAASLHFAVMTLTSIGYGDITPVCFGEYILCCVIMGACGIIWAYIIGNICSVASTQNSVTRNYTETMDQLNDFLRRQELDGDQLARNLRRFVVITKEVHRLESTKKLLEKLPGNLGGECARVAISDMLTSPKVRWMNALSDYCMLHICMEMHVEVLAPRETLESQCSLYHVQTGVISRNNRIMTQGEVFGEDFLLRNPKNVDFWPAVAVTFVRLTSITQRHLDKILEHCGHQDNKVVRKALCMLVFKKLLPRAARRRKNEERRSSIMLVTVTAQEASDRDKMSPNVKGRESSTQASLKQEFLHDMLDEGAIPGLSIISAAVTGEDNEDGKKQSANRPGATAWEHPPAWAIKLMEKQQEIITQLAQNNAG